MSFLDDLVVINQPSPPLLDPRFLPGSPVCFNRLRHRSVLTAVFGVVTGYKGPGFVRVRWFQNAEPLTYDEFNLRPAAWSFAGLVEM